MKQMYFVILLVAIAFVISFVVGDVTEYNQDQERNTWPHQETNPVPSFEPQHDILPEPKEPLMQPFEIAPQPPTDAPYTILLAQTTGYNTVEAQTDSTPCMSASGDFICGRTNVVACPPSIPMYTWVSIDGKMYECLDRTHPRFGNRFDISFDKDIQGALDWGLRTKEVIVYKV